METSDDVEGAVRCANRLQVLYPLEPNCMTTFVSFFIILTSDRRQLDRHPHLVMHNLLAWSVD